MADQHTQDPGDVIVVPWTPPLIRQVHAQAPEAIARAIDAGELQADDVNAALAG